MPDRKQMFGKSSGDTRDFLFCNALINAILIRITYICRRRRSISRERRQSLGLQMKGVENKGMKEDDVKAKPISPLFQNSDFLHNRKNSTLSNGSEKKNNIVTVLQMKTTNKSGDSDPHEDVKDTVKENGPGERINTDRASEDQASPIGGQINSTNSYSYEQHVED